MSSPTRPHLTLTTKKQYNNDAMALTKKDLQQLGKTIQADRKKDIAGFRKDVKKHTDILYEKFRSDVETIGKGWQAISDKVDATFETVGETKEDIEIIKSDISFIKQGLRTKADQDDLDVLEKRVILLEKKTSRA